MIELLKSLDGKSFRMYDLSKKTALIIDNDKNEPCIELVYHEKPDFIQTRKDRFVAMKGIQPATIDEFINAIDQIKQTVIESMITDCNKITSKPQIINE